MARVAVSAGRVRRGAGQAPGRASTAELHVDAASGTDSAPPRRDADAQRPHVTVTLADLQGPLR